MEELFPKNHLSFQRIMNVLILILLTGLWESKVVRSQKDLLKLFGQNCSLHSSKLDTGNPLMHHQTVKMEEVALQKIQLQAHKGGGGGSFSCVTLPSPLWFLVVPPHLLVQIKLKTMTFIPPTSSIILLAELEKHYISPSLYVVFHDLFSSRGTSLPDKL